MSTHLQPVLQSLTVRGFTGMSEMANRFRVHVVVSDQIPHSVRNPRIGRYTSIEGGGRKL